MRAVITGATGLIGKKLVEHWLAQQHTVIVVGRTKAHIQEAFNDQVQAVTWSELSESLFQSVDLVVNLAGANIAAKRWSAKRKEELLSSRVNATKQISEMLAALGQHAPPLFNASAIGIYGFQKQTSAGLPEPLNEDTVIDWHNPTDFLSRIGREWEQAASAAIASGVRVVLMRFGVVISNAGGALPMLARPFYFFMGGPIGPGNQPFSWIALPDLIRAIDFLLPRKELSGPFNFVAPECVSEKQLAKTIGKVLHRPAMVNMPAFAIKLMLGDEMARELLLQGQHVYPNRLLSLGFQFEYPTIEKALTASL